MYIIKTIINPIQQHLDKAASKGYLDSINGTSTDSLIDGKMKMGQLVSAIGSTNSNVIVLSIGVGQGEELHALRILLGPNARIIGLDISKAALTRTAERSKIFDLNLELIESDACNIPLDCASVDAVVMSSVLHEIYSYNLPNGTDAYKRAVLEAGRVLNINGILYIRDFGTPTPEDPVKLQPISKDAKDFYDYFLTNFSVGLDDNIYDRIKIDTYGRLIKTADLSQILMHFRHFWNDRSKGHVELGDLEWKELCESYVIPNPLIDGQSMDPLTLCDDVMKILNDSKYSFEPIEISIKHRRKVNMFLTDHFRIITGIGTDSTARLLPLATSKFEASFRKTS